MSPTPTVPYDRRRPLKIADGLQSAIFRRLLFFEAILIGLTAPLSFLAAWFLLQSRQPDARIPVFGAVLLAAVALAVAATMVFIAVRISHGIVGPMGKIISALRQVRHGYDPGTVLIRSEDQVHELTEALNAAVKALRDRHDLEPSTVNRRAASKPYGTAVAGAIEADTTILG